MLVRFKSVRQIKKQSFFFFISLRALAASQQERDDVLAQTSKARVEYKHQEAMVTHLKKGIFLFSR
jgi:hypothetical protein